MIVRWEVQSYRKSANKRTLAAYTRSYTKLFDDPVKAMAFARGKVGKGYAVTIDSIPFR